MTKLQAREIIAINEQTGELEDLRNTLHQDLINIINAVNGARQQQLLTSGGVGGGGGSGGIGPYDYSGQCTITVKDSHLGAYGGVSGSRPTAPQSTKIPKKTSESTCDNAGGGIIEEEIYGIGKCSGKRYRFGEAGDEAIIPINEFNQMVGTLGRIGTSSCIGGGAKSKSVGRFTGISAGRMAQYTSNLYGAQQAVSGAQGAYDEYSSNEFEGQKTEQYRKKAATFYCAGMGRKISAGGGMRTRNTSEYSEWLKGQRDLKGTLTGAQGDLTSAQEQISPYSGMYSCDQIVGALKGGADTEVTGGGTTNLGGITINVSGASDTDKIVDEIGPKILKYLQDNESRVGIR